MIGSAEIGCRVVEVEKVPMPVGHAAGAGPIIVPGLFGNLSIWPEYGYARIWAMSTTARSTSFQHGSRSVGSSGPGPCELHRAYPILATQIAPLSH
jgi:hypothetical protein